MSEKPTKVLRQRSVKPFRLGHLRSLNQVIVALGKTIRAVADGTIDSAKGARIANALGIQRAALETASIEKLSARLTELEVETPLV
jgi:hypothetical protein